MRKKILIVTDNLPNQINGVVTTFSNIEIQAKKDGFDIAYIDPSMCRNISCPGYPEIKLSWPQVGSLIKEASPDYIHVATEGPLGLATIIHCGIKGYRYNTSYHTKFPEFLYTMFSIPTSLTYLYLRWFHSHSGRVLTTTPTMVNELRSHGFSADIIPWTRGVDRNNLCPTVDHTPLGYNKIPTVLYVGRISKEKSLEDLCRLQDKFNIEIVGGGPQEEYLKNSYPGVNFLGYQSGETLANSYARADVFCFPSRTDTFGIVIIEAMSIGTPIAAYKVPGPMDIIESGVTGFMGNNLEENINNCLLLDRKKIKLQSMKWSWEECWTIFRESLCPVGKI